MNSVMDMATREAKRPYVTFKKVPVEDPAASAEKGHYVARDVDYVYITPAYTKDVIIREVKDWFEKLEGDLRNQRIPEEWIPAYKKQYQAWKEGQELPLEGTPIRGWGVISPAMQETLCHMKILTVEDAAGMNDDAIRRIGMGGMDIKNKALAHLRAAKDTGPLVIENSQLKAKLEVAEATVADLKTKVDELVAYVKAQQRADAQVAGNVPHGTSVGISPSDLMPDDNFASMDDAALAVAFKSRFGDAPHHRMKRETIIEKLRG